MELKLNILIFVNLMVNLALKVMIKINFNYTVMKI